MGCPKETLPAGGATYVAGAIACGSGEPQYGVGDAATATVTGSCAWAPIGALMHRGGEPGATAYTCFGTTGLAGHVAPELPPYVKSPANEQPPQLPMPAIPDACGGSACDDQPPLSRLAFNGGACCGATMAPEL